MTYVYTKNLNKTKNKKKRIQICVVIVLFILVVITGVVFYQKEHEPIKSQSVVSVIQSGNANFNFEHVFGDKPGIKLRSKRGDKSIGESWLYQDSMKTYHKIIAKGLNQLDENHEYRTWLSDAEGNFVQTGVLANTHDDIFEMQFGTIDYIGSKQKVTISIEPKTYKGDHPTDIVLEGVHTEIQGN